MIEKDAWFSSWFDSPYYHILYDSRDELEASCFINNLQNNLKLKKESKVLDLGCGAGRHARELSQLGFQVLGIDLSKNNISQAKIFENKSLSFIQGDMRVLGYESDFDLIVNLFTSFGYFEDFKDNKKVLDNVYLALKSGGIFVLDYLNPTPVIASLVNKEEKIISEIKFNIRRYVDDDFLIKQINIVDKEKDYEYFEKVRLISPDIFRKLFSEANFKTLAKYGDYTLESFNEKTSMRQIFILQK